jgi:hypothetical protein
LWPRYEWDSFERNVNTAVRKLRQAIGDDAREPRLIETMRASGYRWIGPAPDALSSVPAFEAEADAVHAGAPVQAIATPSRPPWRRVLMAGAIAASLIALLASISMYSPSRPRPLLVVDVDDTAAGSRLRTRPRCGRCANCWQARSPRTQWRATLANPFMSH